MQNFEQKTPFGIEIACGRFDEQQYTTNSARETIAHLEQAGEYDQLTDVYEAISQVEQVVNISRENEDDEESLIDIFSADQIIAMHSRMQNYLGSDLDSYLKDPQNPPGYVFFVERLSTQIASRDADDPSLFSSFVTRHLDNPFKNAIGPTEQTSRRYASQATENILNQFKNYYRTDLVINVTGPTKRTDNGSMAWERGVAECQFLVLDYVRDQLAMNNQDIRSGRHEDAMTFVEIEDNIVTLMRERKRIHKEVVNINPMLAEYIDANIESLAEFTEEVMHRGRMGTPRFMREPRRATHAILNIERLLYQAADQDRGRDDQAEIPILDI